MYIWPDYKCLRNRVTSELRRAVEGRYRSLIDENSNNPKEMWKTINKVLNKNQCSTTPRSVMYEGQLVEKQKEIAEAYNNHFTTIGPKLAEKIETKESDDMKGLLQPLVSNFIRLIQALSKKKSKS